MLANKVKRSLGKLSALAYFPVTEDLISPARQSVASLRSQGAHMWAWFICGNSVPDSLMQDLTLCVPVALL